LARNMVNHGKLYEWLSDGRILEVAVWDGKPIE
jgi:hypothetical protein